jgi:hypothetical protein
MDMFLELKYLFGANNNQCITAAQKQVLRYASHQFLAPSVSGNNLISIWMNKKLIIFILLFFCSDTIFSQNYFIGIKPGIAFSDLSFLNSTFMDQDLKTRTNLDIHNFQNISNISYAITGGINFKRTFSVYSEFSLIRKGSIVDINYYLADLEFFESGGYTSFLAERYNSPEFNIDLNYMVIPIVLSYSLGNKIKYCLSTGLYWSYLISAKGTGVGTYSENINGEIITKYGKFNKDMNQYFNKNSFGIRFGYKIEFYLKNKLILFPEIITDVDLTKNGFNPESKNISLILSIGIKYLLKENL